MNLARSEGYATDANARKKLASVIGELETAEFRWVIGVSDKGRFVPCVVGAEHVELAHQGITVLG